MIDAVNDVTTSFADICSTDNETLVFTASDIVYQIGIYWNLICLNNVSEENKSLLKKILLFYMMNLAGKLLGIEDTSDEEELDHKVWFLK